VDAKRPIYVIAKFLYIARLSERCAHAELPLHAFHAHLMCAPLFVNSILFACLDSAESSALPGVQLESNPEAFNGWSSDAVHVAQA